MLASEVTTTQGFVERIEIGKIRPSRAPLRIIDLEGNKELEELTSSIMEKGLLFPIVVRPIDGEEDGFLFEVVAGNRRFEACKKLKTKKIPCYVAEFDDKQAYEVSLVENLQRKTLDPLEEARAFKKYVDEFGYGSISELARKIGKSHSYVSRRIGLLKLPKAVQEKLLVRGAQVAIAEELLSLSNKREATKVLTDLIVEKKLTNRNEVRHLVTNAKRDLLVHDDSRAKLVTSSETYPSYFSAREVRQHRLDRAFKKYIATLKVCMMRMDDVLNSFDDGEEWIVKETLLHYRKLIHKHIDSLLILEARTQRMLDRPATPI